MEAQAWHKLGDKSVNQTTQNRPTGPHVCPSQETLPTCPGPEHIDKNTRGERTHHPQTQQGL